MNEIIANAATGFTPNHPAARRAVNVVEKFFFGEELRAG